MRQTSTSELISNFPAAWLPMLKEAHERFLETGQKPECFQVSIISESDVVLITYIPTPDVKTYADGRVSTSRTESSCGRAVSFEFKHTGEFVRQYYNR